MAQFKNISEVEVVAKDNSQNVLVEQNGAFKKAAMSEMGNGGNDLCGVIVVLTEDLENGGYSLNMTYNELREAILNNTILMGWYKAIGSNYIDNMDYFVSYYLGSIDSADCIALITNYDLANMSGHAAEYQIHPDGTITYGIPGLGGGGWNAE